MNAGRIRGKKISYEPLGSCITYFGMELSPISSVNVFVPAFVGGNASWCINLQNMQLTRIGNWESCVYRFLGYPKYFFSCCRRLEGRGNYCWNFRLMDISLGSYKTGKYIYGKVAAKMVPCQCELVAKRMSIVFGRWCRGYKISRCRHCRWRILLNNGQKLLFSWEAEFMCMKFTMTMLKHLRRS